MRFFVEPDEVHLEGTQGKDQLPLVIWDLMGYTASSYKTGELNFILDGHLPNRFPLNPGVSFDFICLFVFFFVGKEEQEMFLSRK